ncbi:DUF4181 domain-containing protein [Bacillus sp. XF8]|uniref:DUF4181 domain-containing protein n=1 Tax=Bacillus sp. XF8 TaxID=2819289 RepID=UPI001AA08165|nr:DUF4181 domain-containing protein [Bacillus sp. XF8]MBO1580751.1 DUF4181 domain-containing protein [Bacillus sp. XF8]
MGKLLFLIIIVILFFLLENLLRKKLKITRKNGFIYRPVNRFHKWGERIIIIIYLVAGFVCIYTSEYIKGAYILFIFLGTQQLFRAYMEWKFDKESKEYVISLLGVFCLIITFNGMIYLFQPVG